MTKNVYYVSTIVSKIELSASKKKAENISSVLKRSIIAENRVG